MSNSMHLVGMVIAGPTVFNGGSWRHPESQTNYLDPRYYTHCAQVLEEGLFDAVFFADVAGLYDYHEKSYRSILESGGQNYLLDPIPILSMLAQSTKHLGLATTISSSFVHPYHAARVLGTLDHLSAGRAGWNVVTSASRFEARNFGLESLPVRDERYDMADEVLEASLGLWNSWEDGALLVDKSTGRFADASKVHRTAYKGRWIKTEGPLAVPPTPQNHPVIMQAGSSPRGRAFAIRWAELIFTVQFSKPHMQAFYKDMRTRLDQAGRSQEGCRILVGVNPIIAETDSIAREKQSYLHSLVNPEAGMALLSAHTGTDLSKFPTDQPLERLNREEGSIGSLERALQGTISGGSTLQDIARSYGTTSQAPEIVGTPESVADQLQELFEEKACDGFVVAPTVFPGMFESFVRSVVPILQRRGLYRKAYTGTTFRENLLGRKKSFLSEPTSA
jgi:FMN-dependent oxidoreductase (nitrilotriacetate monooxygenase family)